MLKFNGVHTNGFDYMYINAAITLGRNMFSLITNETRFTVKSVYIKQHTARIPIETCLF